MPDAATWHERRDELSAGLAAEPQLSALQPSEVDGLVAKADEHSAAWHKTHKELSRQMPQAVT